MAIRYGFRPRLAILACLAAHLLAFPAGASDQSALCERAIVLGSQRSGALVMVSPPEQFCPNRPSLNLLGPYIRV